MKRLSNNRIPSKYRHLQKRIDEINERLDKLPDPQIDFSLLSPRERDLVEVFYGCIYIIKNETRKNSTYRSYKIDNDEIHDNSQLEALLLTYVNREELKQILNLITSGPKFFPKTQDAFFSRKERDELMSFLESEQNLLGWLPQGRLNEKLISWVSWDETIRIASDYGYEPNQDSIEKMISIQKWKANDKTLICYRLLDMIGSEKVKDNFLKINKLPFDYKLQRRMKNFRR